MSHKPDSAHQREVLVPSDRHWWHMVLAALCFSCTMHFSVPSLAGNLPSLPCSVLSAVLSPHHSQTLPWPLNLGLPTDMGNKN